MPEPDEFPDIDPELLELATDEELFAYQRALEFRARLLDEWGYEPRQRRAEDFCEQATDLFELMYGGAAGGGKSDWLLHHMYDLALRYPGFRGILMRRTFPELRRSLITRSWSKFDPTVGKYLATDHEWRFDNGSVIEFGYCEHDRDVYQYQSAEYDCIGWDELTQFPTDFPYTYMMSRCRTTLDKSALGLVPHIISGTNPGNVGGGWVKARFVDLGIPEHWYEAVLEIEGGEPRIVNRVFVPAKLADNKFINAPQYRLALANLSPATRQALEDGSWDVVEGQFFTDWNRQVHVIPPFEIPRWWQRIRGYDYGYAKQAACLWAAFDGDGNCFVYREWYQVKKVPSQQAKEIQHVSHYPGGGTEKIAYTMADPSIWTKTGVGPPVARQLQEEGLTGLRKAINARVDGWARVRDYLRIDEETKKPRIFVFQNCLNLIRTLPMLVFDDVDPEDLDTDGEDHLADTLRYLLMSKPARSAERTRDPITLEERIAARQAEKRRTRGTMQDTPVGTVW